MVILLVLLIIFLSWQVRFILEPIRALFTAVGAPILIAGVLYYLLSPLVKMLNKTSRITTNPFNKLLPDSQRRYHDCSLILALNLQSRVTVLQQLR